MDGVRIVILGNSGSGKSTLARELSRGRVAVLDLDTIAWEAGEPPVRRGPAARAELQAFCESRPEWIVEGCYGELAEAALVWRPELLLLNPGVEACLRNCRARPWEPHKYATAEAQERNLAFLLDWVRGYETRDDDCSLGFHRAIFAAYSGPKREIG